MAFPGEYPKWLHHPGFAPAVLSDDYSRGGGRNAHHAPPGKPAQFQPVIVHNSDDEAWYVSRGYEAGAYDHAKVLKQQIAPLPNGYREQEYPRFEADGSVTPDPDPPPVENYEFPKWVPGLDGNEIARNAEEERAILARAGHEPEPPMETVEMTPDDLTAFAAWLRAGKPLPPELKGRRAMDVEKVEPVGDADYADEQEGFDASEEEAMAEGREIGPGLGQAAEDRGDVGECRGA